MRGRPLKVDHNATLDETLRRARGRAAQRRYRHRQEQTLAEKEARNEKLESVVQGMIKAFLEFGDHVTRSMAVLSSGCSGDLGAAYHEAVKKFRNLAAEVDEDIYWHQDASPSSNSDDSQQAATDCSLQSTSRTPPKQLSMVDTAYRVGTSGRPPFSEASIKAANISLTGLPSSMKKLLSSGIMSMPVRNPVLSGDYFDIEELSFPVSSLWTRLLRYGMLRSYHALQCDDLQKKEQSWTARAHRFSLRHATRRDLLFLTRLALNQMIEENRGEIYGPASPPTELSVNEVFSSERHRQLAAAVLSDLELEGIRSDIVRAEEIDNYLAKKGTIKLQGNRLELRLFSAKGSRPHSPNTSSSDKDIETVVIDIERFIRKLCDEAICLGNGMGFSKHIVNDVIVYSAVYISHRY